MLLHSKCVDDDPIIMSLTITLALFEVQWHPKITFGFGCLIAFCSYLSHCLHHAQLAAAKYVHGSYTFRLSDQYRSKQCQCSILVWGVRKVKAAATARTARSVAAAAGPACNGHSPRIAYTVHSSNTVHQPTVFLYLADLAVVRTPGHWAVEWHTDDGALSGDQGAVAMTRLVSRAGNEDSLSFHNHREHSLSFHNQTRP